MSKFSTAGLLRDLLLEALVLDCLLSLEDPLQHHRLRLRTPATWRGSEGFKQDENSRFVYFVFLTDNRVHERMVKLERILV